MIGKTISHYKIIEKLGEGGMGVVYKAEDTKLKREVAIKFLPRRIDASDEERERFRLEAQAAAALNHNNIAIIHEIDEVGGDEFIVMEIVKGESLKEKIATGPLKVDEAMRIATEVADGLHEAHENDIVHRDIKPANIMLTAKGQCKIMDFGLAKMARATLVTKEGTTLGTAAYMSPEQARGEKVDHRTDIFSLGVMLYEMLTGQLPFKGDYEQAVLYSIMNEDPEPITAVRTGVPLDLERAVFKCLQKSSDDRYQSANELLVDLRTLRKGLDGSQSKSVAAVSARGKEVSGKSKRGLYALGVIGIAGLVAFFIYLHKDAKPIRLTNPQKITQAIGEESWPTWSPDGTRIAYHSNQRGKWDIWVKQLTGGEPINLTQQFVGRCRRPSWSPDGSQIAFRSREDISSKKGYAIWIVPAIGGTAIRVALTSGHSSPAWSPDGTELAHVVKDSSGSPSAEIYSLATHERRKVTLPGEEFERTYLSWSPRGDFFAYADASNRYPLAGASTLKLVRIRDGKATQITNTNHYELFPYWSLNSRLLYFISTRGGPPDLWQVKLNDEGDVDGNLTQVTNGLSIRSFAFSRNHKKVAFAKDERRSNLWRIAIPKPDSPAAQWANAKQLTFESSTIGSSELSLDGKRIYLTSNRSGNNDIWSMPAEGGELRQLTTTPEVDGSPSLSPDGNTIAFKSGRSGKGEIWTMPSAGGPARQITHDESPKWWPTWSPDGQTLAYVCQDSTSKLNLCVVPAQGGEPQLVPTGPNNVFRVLWWPDGQSLVSIYAEPPHNKLRRFPIVGGGSVPLTGSEVRVDASNGLRWSADRTEIYFFRRGGENQILNIWSLSVGDGSVRQLTELQGRPGRFARMFANDGTYLYFAWVEETGDIWVMDVEREE
jgi:Tol biopolymer transport system component/tRNA A-37 threonylcarbamoyl transferase component Bud32